MNVIIVDDQASNRELCRLLLKPIASDIKMYANGQELIDALLNASALPDVILLDVMMPVKNGFIAACEIRERFPQHHIPIIFLTALDDDSSFEQCLSLGDDFILKPVEKSVIQAKVQAHFRISHMHNEVKQQRDELKQFHELIEYEHSVADSIFSNLKNEMNLHLKNISGVDYLSTPSTLFNGDLIIAACRPHGGAYIMVADATGHGLPAAISTLPAARDFFSMAKKGLSLGEIVTELNSVMERFLPVGMMLAASVFEIKASGLEFAFWGGGLPDGFLLNADGTVASRLKSKHMPLGVLKSNEFEANIEVIQVLPQQKLCCYTDGVIEAKNAHGELFGEARLEEVLSCSSLTISKIYHSVHNHSNRSVDDDLSILILDFPLISGCPERTDAAEAHISQLPCDLSVHFDASLIREVILMNEVRKVLNGIIAGSHLDLICTVLSELLSNAIDHGLLELESDLKQEEDGFYLYFQQRQEKLNQLSDEKWLTFNAKHDSDKKHFVLVVEHNGRGFEHSNLIPDISNNEVCGRGIAIVSELCDSLEYSKAGRCATAVYSYKAR